MIKECKKAVWASLTIEMLASNLFEKKLYETAYRLHANLSYEGSSEAEKQHVRELDRLIGKVAYCKKLMANIDGEYATLISMHEYFKFCSFEQLEKLALYLCPKLTKHDFYIGILGKQLYKSVLRISNSAKVTRLYAAYYWEDTRFYGHNPNERAEKLIDAVADTNIRELTLGIGGIVALMKSFIERATSEQMEQMYQIYRIK